MIKDIIMERRTIRKYYEDKKVDRELLDEILMYSLMGPSYGNSRPVEFLISEDKEKLEKLSHIEMFGTNYLAKVPMVILVMANTELSKLWSEECTIVASYLQLLAQENGLNTAWVDVKEGETKDGIEIQKFLSDIFEIPDKFKTFCIIPIGYGHERVKKRVEFDVASKIHNEKF